MIWEKSYDDFHINSANIYRVSQLFLKNGTLDFHAGATFATVGPAMKDDFPEVLDYCRFLRKWRGGVISYQEKSFKEENLVYVDPSFFEVLSYPLVSGNSGDVLSKPHTAVIDQFTAIKYFGNDDPIGKRITIGSMDGPEEFEITGVAQSLPNSHFNFNLLLSYSSAVSIFGNEVERSWGWWDFHTYILLDPMADISALESRFPAFIDKYGGERMGKERVGFKLQPLQDIHLKSHLRHELSVNGDGDVIDFLLIIAFFIIAVAWINYINLTTAKAFNRAKEVGIRKTMGSNRWQLASQFLTEAFTTNLISIVLGLLLFKLSLPHFDSLIGKSIPHNYFIQSTFWIQVALIWISGSVISGFYPAWVLSSFDPKTALQSSNAKQSHKALMRRALVIFQFMISTSLIAGTLIVYSQIDFMHNRDKGIDTENVISIKAPQIMDQEGNYYRWLDNYRSRIANHSAVLSTSISSDIPGKQVNWMGGSRRFGRNQNEFPNTIIYKHTLDLEYLNLYGNKFLAGRNFEKESDSSYTIINKAALDAYGFRSPRAAINQRIIISGIDTLLILGVIENFHQEKLSEPFKPTLYLLMEQERAYFSIKVKDGHVNDFLSHAETTFNEVFPKGVFEYQWLKDHLVAQYEIENTFLQTFLVFASLAIIIALLGLIGLAFYTTAQRSKEISIRKVLGSTVLGIFSLLSIDMLRQVFYANLIAFPLIIYFSNQWLNGFAFRENLNYSLLMAAFLMTLFSALLIISYHVLKAALINPIVSLRNE